MIITVAKSAGFCFGVNRAVKLVQLLVDENEKVNTLGPIIHNTHVVEDFTSKGVKIIEDVKDIKNINKNEIIVIRSHGVKEETIDKINSLGIKCKNATCPFVTKIQNIVKNESLKGNIILIAGNENHPEVQGIIGHSTGKCYTFNNNIELSKLIEKQQFLEDKPISVVAQTTFDVKEWKKCVNSLKRVYTNVQIFDTICSATSERQSEADFLSKSSDIMLVIGGKHSSNTKKLFDICKNNCKNTYLIEDLEDLPIKKLRTGKLIGVTAGASTPAMIIKEVLDKMSEVNNNKSGEDVEMKESFEEMLEESLKNLNTDERVTGIVVSIAPNEVYVDVGRKQAGYVPLKELTNNPNLKPEDIVEVGDEIELLIMKTNDQEGTIMLSKTRVDAQKGWEELKQHEEDQDVLTGEVIEVVNGGIIALYNDMRVFIPASQATAYRGEPLEDLLKTEVDFRLLEVSQRGRRKRVVGSIRSVLKDKRAEQKEKFWEEVEVGQTYEGVVKSLTNYGAFVDLGGVFGMIHISELSWEHIKHPSDIVSIDETVEVRIKDINKEENKISLAYKKDEENPWNILKNEYPEGTEVDVRIVGLTAFGAFANIIPGIDGLIHISQISNERIDKPHDVLEMGETVKAIITGIDFDKKRVSLSMRALLDDESDTIPEDENVVVATTETEEDAAEDVEEDTEDAEEVVTETVEEVEEDTTEEAIESEKEEDKE